VTVAKKRLDLLVLERGFAESREKAQALIMSGVVLVGDAPQTKSGEKFSEDSEIRLKEGALLKYVSRGGDKLEGALQDLNLNVQDKIILDVGSSTGGFTDCLLKAGAKRSYCIDVGTNQLAFSLRIDERVVLKENCHANLIPGLTDEGFFNPLPNFLVADLSFIGLSKVLALIITPLEQTSALLLLVKPQFELEPKYVEKGGVVRNEEFHKIAIKKVQTVAAELGFGDFKVVPSKVKGGKKGNQEYFLHCLRGN